MTFDNKNTTPAEKSAWLPRFRDLLDQKRQDPEFAQMYDDSLRQLRLGLALCELREARGLTQHDLEIRTGVSQETLSRIERGRQPSLATLKKITKALDARIVLHPDDTVSVEANEPLARAA